jgi:hypothetical protein
MNLKFLIPIVIVIILIPLSFVLLKNTSVFNKESVNPNSIEFFEKNFVFNSLTFKATVNKMDKVSIDVTGLEGNKHTLPIETTYKVYKDQLVNGKIETLQIDAARISESLNKTVTLVLNKDDAGTYRVSIIHLPQ